MKVTIYPDFDLYYYSFYLEGIFRLFPGASLLFSAKPFPVFTGKCLAVVVRWENEETRIIIDGTDGPEIRSAELKWCDVYGKVNLHRAEQAGSHDQRVIPIGPSFGVNLWGRWKSLYMALKNYACGRGQIASAREYFANYRRQYRYRLPEDRYRPASPGDSRYIFHLSSLWSDHPTTNSNRAAFIDACRRQPEITFEGGFAPLWPGHEVQEYADAMVPRRYPLPEWVEKTSRSCLVFNTPAVYGCHGWKLAEYLALGKAIISTPLARELPSPLLHGHHIHYVQPRPDAIREGVELVANDARYRARLEHNAYQYYCTYLSPGQVMKRLFYHGNRQVICGPSQIISMVAPTTSHTAKHRGNANAAFEGL